MKFRTMPFFIISFFLVANNIFPVFAMEGQRLKRRSISPLSSHLIVATYTSLIEITTAFAKWTPRESSLRLRETALQIMRGTLGRQECLLRLY